MGLCANRASRKGRRPVSREHTDFNHLGDLLSLCAVSRVARPGSRGAGVGQKDTRQEADDARISAAAGASVVSAGQRGAGTSTGLKVYKDAGSFPALTVFHNLIPEV